MQAAGLHRVERNCLTGVPKLLVQHMCSSKSGVTAKGNLNRRRKPAKRPHSLPRRNDIGRLGDVVFCRNRLQGFIRQECLQRHDARLVAFESL